MEFAIGGDLAEKENEQIDFEAWDYHWVSKPGSLTWYTLDTHSAHHLYMQHVKSCQETLQVICVREQDTLALRCQKDVLNVRCCRCLPAMLYARDSTPDLSRAAASLLWDAWDAADWVLMCAG